MKLTYNGVDLGRVYVADCTVCGARLRIEDDLDLCANCLVELLVVAPWETDENGKISRNC